ncbi:2542_t:CDS:2, partial [Paraglomus brasilianum]
NTIDGPCNRYITQPESESYVFSPPLNITVNSNKEGLDGAYFTMNFTGDKEDPLLNAFGLLGGVWTTATGFYAILLGSDSLQPLGYIQMYCCCFARHTRLQFYKSFSTTPSKSSESLITSLPPDLIISSSNSSLQVTTLQKRLDTLELFLKEYVVDKTYLEDVEKDEIKPWEKTLMGRISLIKAFFTKNLS